jgi:hypothetical protein
MITRRKVESPLNAATVLQNAGKRQQASQLLLLAIIDKRPMSITDVRQTLRSCLAELKKTAKKDYYFDLGWLETSNTILDDFTSLNWADKHYSVLTYQSTKIGKAALIEQWQGLESYFGMSLEQFQKLC